MKKSPEVIRQIMMIIEDKPGSLSSVLEPLGKSEVNVRGYMLCEDGILQLIVSNVDIAIQVLEELKLSPVPENVLAVLIDDVPGSLDRVFQVLQGAGLNIEYSYACIGNRASKAISIFSLDNIELGLEVLKENGFFLMTEEDFGINPPLTKLDVRLGDGWPY